MSDLFDVAIIGAGPSGAAAAALLARKGRSVCVIERSHFPRFVIGESMLPYGMDILAEAGLLEAVEKHGFHRKNGVFFNRYDKMFDCRFENAPGKRPYAYNVERAEFDYLLMHQAQAAGAQVRFGQRVEAFDNSGGHARLRIAGEDGADYELSARFVFDASGYFHVLPRLLDWEQKPKEPKRQVHCTYIDDNTSPKLFNRRNNIISAHPKHKGLWLWLFPLSPTRSSVGIVGSATHFEGRGTSQEILQTYAAEIPLLSQLLQEALWDNGSPYHFFPGYSAAVKSLFGRHFVLVGNAGQFIDPVFSSGVTTALHSVKLAVPLAERVLAGETVDWQKEFTARLAVGNHVFYTLIKAWYGGSFEAVMFRPDVHPQLNAAVSAIMAGYAWDLSNPYVQAAVKQPRAGFAEIAALLS